MQLQLQTVILNEHALNNLNIAIKGLTTVYDFTKMHCISHRKLSLEW